MITPQTWTEGARLLSGEVDAGDIYFCTNADVELPGQTEWAWSDRYIMNICISEDPEEVTAPSDYYAAYFPRTEVIVLYDIEEQSIITAYQVDDDSINFIHHIAKAIGSYIKESMG